MFPRKSATMTPSQVMGHHRMMMQQGMSAGAIASSMVNLSNHNRGLPGFAAGGGSPECPIAGEKWTEAEVKAWKEKQETADSTKGRLAEEGCDGVAKADASSAEAPAMDVGKPKKCFLHPKPNKNCKKCQQAQQALSQIEASKEKSQQATFTDDSARSSSSSEKKTIQCSPMLREQIVNCSYFKRCLDIRTVENHIHEIAQSVDTIDVYNQHSKISPSCFICHVFRLSFYDHRDLMNDLDLIIDHRQSSVVRCVGFLYIRFITPPMELWDMLEEYLLDDMELVYAQDGNEIVTTIGEYVEALLTQDKYFDSPLPRLPVKVKQLVEEKVAPMLQHRKRMQANRLFLKPDEVEDKNISVEVNMDGVWMRGTARGFASKAASRLKLKVRLEGGVDVKVHLGKVIIADDDRSRGASRGRSRSRSRGRRAGSPDWSRYKGKSDAEMLQELRDKKKDEAVCGHGKSYAKRPLNFDAQMASTALANPAAEAGMDFQGQPNSRGNRGSREDEVADEEARQLRRRREEDERQRNLASVYKKYCAAPSQSQGSAYSEVDKPDMLRLG